MIAFFGPKPKVAEYRNIARDNITDNLKDAGIVFIPACGINIQKRFRRQLTEEHKVAEDKIIVISKEVLEKELNEQGSVKAFEEHCKTHIPYINSLEFEVAHHCNLNCRGCNHFSPLSDKKYGDINSYGKDLKQLRKYVDHIGEIRLVGGEPLLNPELPKFVEVAREICPADPIAVITNGIRLGIIDDELTNTMRKTGAYFQITAYPPMKEYIPKVTKMLDELNIRYSIFWDADQFCGQLNPKGDSDMEKAESVCFSSECHIIEDGYISKCTISHKSEVFRKYYNLAEKFPDCRLDLYSNDMSAHKLLSYLMKPIEMCRFCGKWNSFDWSRAVQNPPMEDWFCSEKF